jgi:probable rRNA maturation factor
MTVRLAGPPRGEGLPAFDRRLLLARSRALLRALARPRAELSLALLDDAEMARLNRRWRGRPGPTDVLSFSQLEGAGQGTRGRLLGDVAIGLGVAARQAHARHRALDEELARLLIHGTLHLLGHDHEREEEARAMRAEERRLWRVLRQTR